MGGRFARLWPFPVLCNPNRRVGDYSDERGCGQECLVLQDYRDASEARRLVSAATIPKDLLFPGPLQLERKNQ